MTAVPGFFGAASVEECVETISDQAFWEGFAAELSISEQYSPEVLEIDHALFTEQLELLKVDGYSVFESILDSSLVAPLAEVASRLSAESALIPFLAIYDQCWDLLYRMQGLVGKVLGDDFLVIPDLWAWALPASENARGWVPHRDKLFSVVHEDGMPMSLTLWFALTDATSHNGCIMMQPGSWDPNYPHNPNLYLESFQDIRALPVPAGSLLMWNHAVMHWGGRSSRWAKQPRIAVAFEVQQCSVPEMRDPVFTLDKALSFEQRLGLVGKQVLHYQHTYPTDDATLALAEALVQRFPLREMPGGFA